MTTANKSVMLILLMGVAAAGAWLLGYSPLLQQTEPRFAMRLPQTTRLPEFQLLNHNGDVLTNDWFNDRWTLVFFGFTNCPDICPATLQLLSAARRQMAAADSEAMLPDILLISVDPERDTVDLLQQYVSHFGEGVSGATGTIAELNKLTRTLGVYFEKQPAASETELQDYNVAHSAHVIVIDQRGNYYAVFSAPHSIEAFVTDMPILMRTQ
jgi:protein SCO1/2